MPYPVAYPSWAPPGTVPVYYAAGGGYPHPWAQGQELGAGHPELAIGKQAYVLPPHFPPAAYDQHVLQMSSYLQDPRIQHGMYGDPGAKPHGDPRGTLYAPANFGDR